MKQPPGVIDLSIVVLNYNTRRLLGQCLESLPKLASYQVVVVDNASSDGSMAMVAEDFPGVEIIQNKSNLGFTKGNNAARGKVFGRYVLFLNSDTKVYKGTLEAMVKFLDGRPEAGIATCRTLLPDGRLYYACHRGFPTPWNSLCYFLGLAKLFPRLRFFAGYTATYLPMNKVHEIDACSATFLLIRKGVLDKIGWFDEDYFAYGEDIEMCYRVKELGLSVLYNPHVAIRHYWGASTGLKSTSRSVATVAEENSQRWDRSRYEAMKIFYDKHYRKKYPEVWRWLVFAAISLARYLRKGD